MILLVAENPLLSIDSILGKLSNIPNSSRIYVNVDNFYDCLKIISNPPVLTSKWLVLASPKLSVKQLETLLSYNINILIQVSNLGKYEELKEEYKNSGLHFKILNNLKPPKERLISYVATTLEVDYELAKYICGRHKYYLKKVVESVYILSTIDKIDKASVKKYTERFEYININRIADKLLGLDNLSRKRAIDSIYKFRYGFDYFLKQIKHELDLYEYVFSQITLGNLNLTNFREFKSDNKAFNKLHSNRKHFMIQSYEILSYEKLYYIRLKVNEIEPKASSIYKLIRMLGG